jgi:hypothetical protein
MEKSMAKALSHLEMETNLRVTRKCFPINSSGGYIQDKKHGKGIFFWSSGEMYEGNYENGKEHGLGKMTWKNGTKYIK